LAVFAALRDLIGKADCLDFVGRGIKAKTKIQEPVLVDQLWLGNNQIAAMV